MELPYINKNNIISQEFDGKRLWLINSTWSSGEQNFEKFVAAFAAETLREKNLARKVLINHRLFVKFVKHFCYG